MKHTLSIILTLFISINLFGQSSSIERVWQKIEKCTENLHAQDSIEITKDLYNCIKVDSVLLSKLEENRKEFEVIILLIESHYLWIEGKDKEAIRLLKNAEDKYIKETKGFFKRKKRKVYQKNFNVNYETFVRIRKLFQKRKFYPKPPVIPASQKEIGDMPKFDFPPPISTSNGDITTYFKDCSTLGLIDRKLSEALRYSGYIQKDYYYIPDGFVLVTQIERITNKGNYYCSSGDVQKRCSSCSFRSSREISFDTKDFSISDYVSAFFWGREANFRFFVFIVSNKHLSYKKHTITQDEAQSWNKGGYFRLPTEIATISFSKDYSINCLVYEFKAKDYDKRLVLIENSGISIFNHLKKAEITRFLEDE